MRRYLIIAAALGGVLLAAAARAAPQSERNSLGADPEQAPPRAGAPSTAVADYERIGRFIYAYHRAGVSVEKLRDPLIARRAPPDLARRAADLADQIERVTSMRAVLPDDELKATLREAELVSAAIARWRDAPAG